MIPIDLVTGFLGSGKTTFLKQYAKHLAEKGIRIGIIVNDFGGVNVDTMILQEALGESCEVEQILSGSSVEDWKRRFRTKLIAMAMQGFERIVVEPSGIFDVDAFFDVLYDEPLSRRYEVGNIYTIVEPMMVGTLSKEEESLLVSQLANAGMVVVSKLETELQTSALIPYLQEVMERFHCRRDFFSKQELLTKKWDTLSEEDWEKVLRCGYRRATSEKLWFSQKEIFQTIAILGLNPTRLSTEEQNKKMDRIRQLFSDETFGNIRRAKGFFRTEEGNWLQVNATKAHMETRTVSCGQDVLLVIGRGLNESRIRSFFQPAISE